MAGTDIEAISMTALRDTRAPERHGLRRIGSAIDGASPWRGALRRAT